MMKKFIISLSLFLGIILFFSPQALAVDNQASPSADNKIIEVKKDEVINHDFFGSGSDININGIVNGDVFALGGNIKVDGKINGDLIAASGTLIINGEVTNNVRAGAGTVTVNGLVGRSLTVLGGNIFINEKASIKGSLLIVGSNININGPVTKDARLYGEKVNINTTIDGNVYGSMVGLALGGETEIAGDLNYQGKDEAQIAEEAIIIGQTTYQPLTKNHWQNWKPAKIMPLLFGVYGLGLYLKFTSVIMALVFGLLFLYFFSKRLESMAKIIHSRFWVCLGWGVLIPIIFAFMIIFLVVSLVGIPLIFIFIPLFGMLLYFSKIFTAFALGRRILGEKKAKGWVLALGLSIYFILGLIWGLNSLIGLIFTSVGLGAFFLDQKSYRQISKKVVKLAKK